MNACSPSTATNSSTTRFDLASTWAGSTPSFSASAGFPINSLRNQGNASDNIAVKNNAANDGRNTVFSAIR